MPEMLNFYDVATKKKFSTSDYIIKKKSGRTFAVTKRNGREVYRIVSKDFKK